MEKNDFLLVSSEILPPIFKGVLDAKELLANGRAANASQATKMAGISRSAFYKYRDFVFRYAPDDSNCVNLSVVLSDKAGVFSAMTSVLSENDVNIITVNQGMPVDGAAAVSLTIRTDRARLSSDRLLEELKKVDGVISVKVI